MPPHRSGPPLLRGRSGGDFPPPLRADAGEASASRKTAPGLDFRVRIMGGVFSDGEFGRARFAEVSRGFLETHVDDSS
jgi:hypothetical protein